MWLILKWKNAISLKVFGAALAPPRLLVKISRSGVDRPHHRGLVSVGTVTPTPSHLLSDYFNPDIGILASFLLGFWWSFETKHILLTLASRSSLEEHVLWFGKVRIPAQAFSKQATPVHPSLSTSFKQMQTPLDSLACYSTRLACIPKPN